MVLSKNGAWAITLAVGAFIMISLMLYITVDSNAKRRASSYKGIIAGEDLELQRLRERVENLKNRAEDNRKILNKLNEKIVNVISEPKENGLVAGEEMDQEKQQQNQQQIPAPAENKFENFCPSDDIILSHNASGDVQMLNVYDIIPFDNEDGGVWKQGWPIEYDKAKIMQEKRLEVIVVPHSHNDPGWLKTFEGYFEDQTRHILDYMVTHLDGKLDLSFIYAEMSFFELWWSQQNEETKKKVKSFLQRGQLEIVTGGWVMTDEANSHYFSTIMELFEGHEFLQNQMNYVPKNHWSIDPFGLSPTLAYILNRANLSNMVIQRVHYSVKKYLAKTKQLEFIWRQLFAGNAKNTDIITHMFPFYSYDAPHSCGPDPMVCCQFDFRRMHGQINCPWGKSPLPITEENVGERAELLADQYRKKAQLYGFNTILIPLGDDFRYEINTEWTEQYANYKKLFDYMNKNEHLNIHARFGTLADYFELLHKRLEEGEIEREHQKGEGKLRHSIVRQNTKSPLPILSGDFFTYADRDDHYWSGYFTSRPFYKHMDRSLQHYLRAADILFTLANWKGKMPIELMSKYNDLVDARRSLSLFQHHDGVTGTAKTAVMMDYGQKMAKALTYSKQIIANSAQFLMNIPSNIAGENGGGGLRVDEEHFVNRLPEKFTAEDGSTLVVANTLGQSRKEVICANVNDIKSRINGQKIQQQIGPIFYVDLDGNLAHYLDKFELCFLAELPPFGLVRFDIIKSEDLSHKVKIFSSGKFESNVFEVKTIDGDKEAKISNSNMDVMIDSTTGLIKSVRKGKGGPNLDLELSFVRYGARQRNPARRDGGDSLSGAYLFLPDGPATELPTYQNVYVIAKGSIREFLYLKGPAEVDIRHQISLDVNSEFVSLQNKVNLAQQNVIDRGNRDQSTNYELAMRIRVPSIGGDNFFTDLNGFQMIRRRRQSKLPLQAHFYPMPGAAFIQDSQFRVSLLGRQALGAASLQSGEMQIMLDRRLIQDDDRGLGQGVEDNVQTESRFDLFIEQFTAKSTHRPNDTIAFHSMAAHHATLALHYPPILLFGQLDHAASSEVPPTFSGLKRSFPCDVHPVAFRTLSQPTVYPDSSHPMSTTNSAHTSPKREAALVLHRFGIECTIESTISNLICPPDSMESSGKIDLPKFFHQSPASIHRGSLTLLHIEEEDKKQKNTIKMDPMELVTMKIEF